MARILLVNVPFYRLLGSKYNAHSLGLAYVASAFKNSDLEVAVYNADFADSDYKSLSELVSSQENYLDFFKNKEHPLWNEVVEKILEFEPDSVGYTCYTANVPTIELLAEKVKKRDKNIAQVVGGPHFRIKYPPSDFHVYGQLDGVVENPLPNIDRASTCEVDGLFKNSLDDHLFPNREDFWGVDKSKVDLSYIITSRGCPYKCTFCANPGMWQNKVRFRSVGSVISELKEMRDKHNVQEAYILDDTFTLNAKRAKELMREMILLEMSWRCNTRLDRLDAEICDLMKKSGCIEAKVGIETGSKRMLKLIKKGETKEDMRYGIKLLKEAGIPITGYFLTGFPEETDKDLQETINFAHQIDIDRYSLSVFAPYYGSEIYYDMSNKGKLSDIPYQYFYHQASRPLANDQLSDKMLEKYFELTKLNKDKRYDK